ncbi:MAG: hypothetical protein QOJ38_87, partial [Solirubrobacterales bacterium]|nr:hypothetical protein [Solirubrobacterales bacterium]
KAPEQTKSGYLFNLSSYFLNGFTFAGSSGIGWGVGDRGAIERLGGNEAGAGGTTQKESAPALGAKRTGPAPPRQPYQSTQPALTADPGEVPARSSQPLEKLSAPKMTSYGSPNPHGDGESVSQVVMSRDGSEGWAIGPFPNQGSSPNFTLFHFDGGRWRRCGTDSVEGVIKADPACESLWPLAHFNSTGVKLTAIARIPMENSSDPTKADDFEVIAVGSPDKTLRQPILRYHDGRWAVDEAWTNQLSPFVDGAPRPLDYVTDVAFSGPDDGWIITKTGFNERSIYHFDGKRWAMCGELLGGDNKPNRVERNGCHDHNRVIPAADVNRSNEMHLTGAGDRLYLYATRLDYDGDGQNDFSARSQAASYPVVIYKNRGPCEKLGDPGCWQQAYDPGCIDRDGTQTEARSGCVPDRDPLKRGSIYSLSVALGPDGSYNGWGLGVFGADGLATGGGAVSTQRVQLQKGASETPLIHSDAGGTKWKLTPVGAHDAASQNLLPPETGRDSDESFFPATPSGQVVALPGSNGKGYAVAVKGRGGAGGDPTQPPSVWLNPADQKWRVVQAPYCSHNFHRCSFASGYTQAMAPDNAGGLWIAAAGFGVASEGESIFYRFSDHAPAELFHEVAHPIREQIIDPTSGGSRDGQIANTAAAGGGDGSFWVLTTTNVIYRYDRQTGWDRMTVPGWDPGRVVTNPSQAYAIAIGKDGNGVLVGKQGRIADLSPGGAALDPAAGTLCSKRQNQPPCGTGRDLRAASVAPDGSAMVGGNSRALLYRQGGTGAFHAITPPPAAVFTNITGVSLPSADRAWVTTNAGEIWGGSFGGTDWSWKQEDADEFGDSLSRDTNRHNQPLWAIAMDASGHGYAVGANGTIIERTGEGTPPWKRVDAGVYDELHSVTLGPGGKGALMGGDGGLILSEADGHFEPALVRDRFAPTNWGYAHAMSRIAGLALLPGHKQGEIEAWAVSQVPVWQGRNPPPGAILHYTNAPSEPLLDGAAKGTSAVADSPKPSADELSFAAFGNSECQYAPLSGQAAAKPCPPLGGSNEATDLVASRVRDEALARKDLPGGLDFSLFSGDVGSIGGTQRNVLVGTPFIESEIHDRWRELIADPLTEAGVPMFGAIGSRDLGTTASTCQPIGAQNICTSADDTRAGLSTAWRQSMAIMPAPWGALRHADGTDNTPPPDTNGLSFVPVDTGGTKQELSDTTVADPTKDTLGGQTIEDQTKKAGGQSVPVPDPTKPGQNLAQAQTPKSGYVGDVTVPKSGLVGDQNVPTGGAHTHYALDVKRDGKALMRLVVLDTSLKSLAASNHNQNPVEEQLGWLKDALQRPAGERAVVLTNTPTYSYGPGANTDTLTEGTVLESILLQNKVDLVVDGRLGWNALYWALAPGVHWPCPGDTYKSAPPQGLPSCNGLGSSQADRAAADAQKSAAELSGGVSASGTLPFLVAHSAGGKFGPDGQATGSASQGFWRGYSIVHLDTQTGQVRVEQRPVFDWIGIAPASGSGSKGHLLRPRQSISLAGYGREVLGTDMSARYDDITTPAITHCYDLVLADQEKPWLALKAEDASKEQLAAAMGGGCKARSAGIATASSTTNPCDPYVCLDPAIGRLTDDQQGKIEAGDGNVKRTFAIAILSVNQKVATYPISFEPRPSFTPEAPPPPPPPNGPPPPPPPPPPPNGQLPQINLPTPPVPPSVPLDAGLVAPPPPAVPPPPGASSATPLNLFLNGPGLNIAPQSTVVPPPAPPIQPAPPGGARKEARQKQAATQDSGADSSADEGSEVQSLGGDQAAGLPGAPGSAMTRHDPGPNSNASTRRDRVAPVQSFTPLASHHQPSAWARDLQWGGGLILMALVLAFGWITVRPTPRRREPELPAPAWIQNRRR